MTNSVLLEINEIYCVNIAHFSLRGNYFRIKKSINADF